MPSLANGRVNLKFINTVLVQKGFSLLYGNLVLNLYIAYELNTWPHNIVNNFTLKNCLSGTVKLVKSTIKSKFVYNGQEIAFDREGSWSFSHVFLC